MNGPSQGEHERLLRQVLLGELAPDDPQFVAATEADSELRRQYEELRHLTRSLDQAGEEEAAALAEARGTRQPEDRARVAEAIQGLSRRPRPRRRKGWVLVAAAAVALAVVLREGEDSTEEPDPDRFLGSSALECLRPVGAVTAFDAFHWRGAGSEGGWFELRIESASADSPFEHVERKLRGTEWLPPGDVQESFPDRLRWEVRRYDASGALLESSSARAVRRD